MPLQTVSVSVDIPDGYEACGSEAVDTRPVIKGDGRGEYMLTRVLVRPAWKWPEFVKPGHWIAMDESGAWWCFPTEPEIETSRIWVNTGVASAACMACFEWTPPPCTDWRQSKRQKPL